MAVWAAPLLYNRKMSEEQEGNIYVVEQVELSSDSDTE